MNEEILEGKLTRLERIKDYLEYESMILADETISNRIRMKMMNQEKIIVLFICHRPTVWNSLKSVYNALSEDDLFDVKVLAIPNKKQLPELGASHEIYESEGAEDFWKGKNCINGYEYETGKWIDPRTLKPDYVFYQQPYNICLPKPYKSWIVSKYAKICYVSYGYQIAGGEIFESVFPMDFMRNVKLLFSSDKYDTRDINAWFDQNNNRFTKVVMSGNPRFDLITEHFPLFKKSRYTALWTPRWSTSENNCFFFDFKDRLLEYCDENIDFQLVFRPHPQSFLEWEATGELSSEEADLYRKEYDNRSNARIDNRKDYLYSLVEVDCFITDMTSLMAEYLCTGKPIIYCHKQDCFTDAGRRISQGCYWVRNFDELQNTLNLLRKGEDPLRNIRNEIYNEMIYRPQEGAAKVVREEIKNDFMKG